MTQRAGFCGAAIQLIGYDEKHGVASDIFGERAAMDGPDKACFGSFAERSAVHCLFEIARVIIQANRSIGRESLRVHVHCEIGCVRYLRR